jgi:hypothetical protein
MIAMHCRSRNARSQGRFGFGFNKHSIPRPNSRFRSFLNRSLTVCSDPGRTFPELIRPVRSELQRFRERFQAFSHFRVVPISSCKVHTFYDRRTSWSVVIRTRQPLRPGASWEGGDGSEFGFLGPGEDLRKVMARDNEVVMRSGLTFQALAEVPLHCVAMARALSSQSSDEPARTTVNGYEYEVRWTRWQSGQISPIPGDRYAKFDVALVATDSSLEPFSASELTYQYILNYGICEGYGTTHRLSPECMIAGQGHLRDYVPNLEQIVTDVDTELGFGPAYVREAKLRSRYDYATRHFGPYLSAQTYEEFAAEASSDLR